MLRTIALTAAIALGLGSGAAFAAKVPAGAVTNIDFPFDGIFGSFDKNQLQRGLQVYTEVCAACHGLKYVPIRTLADKGGPELPEDQVRAYAKFYEVFDADLDDFREAKPTDNFPASQLENAPDLSLIAKARAGFSGPYGLGINQFINGIGGAEYVVAILNGYTGKEKEEAGATLYENIAFPGGWIAMAPPLDDDLVEYADGSPTEAKYLAEDTAAFLMWTAEPHLNGRKRVGFLAVIFLSVLASLLYLTNKRIWAPHKGKYSA